MQKEFLNHLSSGYKNRKYDLDKRKIEKFIDSFFRFVFFLEYQRCNSEAEIHLRLESFKLEFQQIINSVIEDPDMKAKAASCFFEAVPHVYNLLEKDAQFILDNDPAATHIEEVMVSYPGFYAISIYRFAHQLHLQGVPLIPRIWTELAHSKTGIVIGETTVIGNFVKIYQNVTLGALAVSKDIANTKRHPTIENNVTVYANTTILGGNTIIREGSTIGGNVWLTESIEPYSLVYYKNKTIIRSKEKPNEPINFSI